ncbi:hypothetical protein GEMRC1_006268 [Eukaryota sp. GEM-RC1]
MLSTDTSIQFLSNFECSNIGEVHRKSEWEYDIYIRPDPKFNAKGPALWFYFGVSAPLPSTMVLFNIIGQTKTRSNYRQGQTPLVRTSTMFWSKVHPKNLFYYRCPQHDNTYVMSFLYKFSTTTVHQFAYSFPYTYSQLQLLLFSLMKLPSPTMSRSLLTRSLLLRRVDLLSSNPLPTSSIPYPTIFISARSHPGETPSSIVMEGLLEYLFSPCSQRLRSTCAIRVVPILNVDGVITGNYRADLLGNDFNRVWDRGTDPSIFYSELVSPIKCFTDLVLSSISDPLTFPAFALDLHSHSQKSDCFLFGNSVENEANLSHWDLSPTHKQRLVPDAKDDESNTQFYLKFLPDDATTFGKILDRKDKTFSMASCRFSSLYEPGSTQGTQRKSFGKLLKPYCGHAQTLEVSSGLSSGLEVSSSSDVLYNGSLPQFSYNAYKNLGWNVGFALDEYIYDKYSAKKCVRKFWQADET